MVDIRSAVNSATRSRGWHDDVSAIRRQLGSGAARYLADATGVHPDTARRWIATAEGRGHQQPDQKVAGRIAAIAAAANDEWVTADALHNAQILHCGHVKVVYNGKTQGFRKVGTLSVDAAMSDLLSRAADEYAAGNTDAAEQLLSDAILGGYSRERARDGRRITAGTLRISDFQSTFSIS
jgi:hypothetical protein